MPGAGNLGDGGMALGEGRRADSCDAAAQYGKESKSKILKKEKKKENHHPAETPSKLFFCNDRHSVIPEP